MTLRSLMLLLHTLLLPVLLVIASPHAGAANSTSPDTVFLEEMTSPELRLRIAAGATTILVPIGGTEQNGPHMVLGKHNVRARILAEQIARALGNTVVAPVIAYVPEGTIQPPVAHMRFSGTISIPESAFEAVLEGAARSFKQHGFRDVVFLGDHGGYQKNEARVASRLNREWARDAQCRVHALPQYYAASQAPFIEMLKAKGFTSAEIGTHAGLSDTALALAVAPALVRSDRLALGAKTFQMDGVSGDPRRSTAEIGQWGVHAIVDVSVAAIREAIRTRLVR
ncbi:creatininase family protein [Candidatus Aalborgicola defluviihabitans]|uniref:creatininase family protein n=1 Tax=Candidatus Aalborgicola defluviihabitans TaxID=3386187 RepID=UPI00390BAFA0|nr:creatininase family protein [Burkholderiales bacterium]